MVKEQTGLFNSGRRVIVYSAETYLCQCITSTLYGFSVRDRDFKAFSTVLREKILPPSSRIQDIDEWFMELNKLIQSFNES